MFSITKRLEQAQQAAFPKEHHEEEHVKAGRNAESTVVANLRLYSGLDITSIFCGLRVPDEYQTRKQEIDIVLLLSTGIVCLEVKNLGGSIKVSEDGHTWVQTKKRKLGDNSYVANFIEHDNCTTLIKKKALLLKEHLLRKSVFINSNQLRHFVVLVNENSELDDKIRNDPSVITPEKCEGFFKSFRKGYVEAFQESLTPSFVSGKLSYTQINAARAVLSTIGTWDIIELHGGKRLYGDLKDLPGVSVERNKVEALEVSHQRNYTLGMVWAAVGYTPTVTVSLLERDGSGWLWNTYVAVVKIPYNTEVVFRVCGDEVDSKVSINDVIKIQISK
ncbi:uncharacterized protein LOC110251836 [Exaiptasia diaphana]|uniref:NERD domain-containing protein n=1 Tax=Exaiptasia diaphana TaxID=2652724 RepID=A0A913Y2W2_EXADI|nr:uncharacterized protein LOC110251836 [Exaiptasia diaphana]KXJ22751.1 hypothetical protein AC249_AIPGENE26087 [Exaiptasia diaphana]